MLTLLKPQEFNCITDYLLKSLGSVNLAKIEKFFNRLPADPYLEGNYRFRRLSNFKVSSNSLVKLPHDRLFQSKNYNPLLGDVVREFEELDEQMLEVEDFKNMVFEFFAYCQVCSTYSELGVHQIRTTTSAQKIGNPAPEGIHRDGVDLVGIFCVNRENIEGGETCLYRDKNSSPVFKKILNPGELLVFSDRHFYHYTAPIKPSGDRQGIRDVFVITCPGLMPKQYETN